MKKLNPDALGDLYKACKELSEWLYGANVPYSEEKVSLKRMVKLALAKAEGKDGRY